MMLDHEQLMQNVPDSYKHVQVMCDSIYLVIQEAKPGTCCRP